MVYFESILKYYHSHDSFPYYAYETKSQNSETLHAELFFAGMNTGVQDAHNLAWKLCLLLNGIASPSIMQTYESERRPVSLFSQALFDQC